MNKIFSKLFVTSLFLFLLIPAIGSAERFQATGDIDVYFSPKGGATEAIVKEINAAKSESLT